jgi:hypothetical protein
MELFDPLGCSNYKRNSLYNPEKLFDNLLNDYSTIVLKALNATKPKIAEATDEFTKLIPQLAEQARYKRILRGWKPTGDALRDFVRLLGVITANDMEKQLIAKVESLRAIATLLENCGKLYKRALRQWKIVYFLLKLVGLISFLLSVLVAIAFDNFLANILQKYLQVIVPDLAKMITIIIIAAITKILIDPYVDKLLDRIRWRLMENKCKSFTEHLFKLRELLVSLEH